MADLHRGAEDDGHVLETHLVEPFALNHVHHVNENPLDQISKKNKKNIKETKIKKFEKVAREKC